MEEELKPLRVVLFESRNLKLIIYEDFMGNPVGPARVWLKHENIPGLAMARSIGDRIAAQVGVIPDPGK